MKITLTLDGGKIIESDDLNVIGNFAERAIRSKLLNLSRDEMDYSEIHTNVDINIY